MRDPRIFVHSPAGILRPGVALAASRAGAIGVIDPGSPFRLRSLHALFATTARLLKSRGFGVRLVAEQVTPANLSNLPASLSHLVVVGDGATDWSSVVREAERVGKVLVAEVTRREDAQAASRAGIGRLVVAGNEGGGRVGEESSSILLQAVLEMLGETVKVWVRGGIGPDTAAGCVAGGAAGVVLDGAVLLARESPLEGRVREVVRRWDGGETTTWPRASGGVFRGYAAVGTGLGLEIGSKGLEETLVGWGAGQVWPVGQDAAFARGLEEQFTTVGGIVQEVERAIDEGLSLARAAKTFAAGSPLARSFGSKFPIVQGPMTRVSDRPAFAKAVADGGGMPFLALALMRGAEVTEVLEDAKARLGGQSWGVGVLGFAPAELRREQNEAILRARPPHVLIAGGRPDQARPFEEAGIRTLLHVPSPALLEQFLKAKARRFVLEGRECGGHVGPRSGFVLWEQCGQTLRRAIERDGVDPAEVHFLYAGGIHDARSAAMVSAIAGPLVKLGVKVGVLIGTAYLFTAEAIATGAIVEGFQQEALRCESTVLLESGPGHLVRVSPTPYLEQFTSARGAMIAEGRSSDAIREALERMNVGRLRIAAKGLTRGPDGSAALQDAALSEQRSEGLYMLGQAATLRTSTTTIADLHHAISEGSEAYLDRLIRPVTPRRKKRARPSDVAIIGMSAVLPGAENVQRFWENTLKKRDAIEEIPEDRWDWRLYYDADPKAPDKIISRWGGFLPEIPFDPLTYGMPPTSLPSIEPLHLITLEVVRAALEDAGYGRRSFPKERTAVVLGAGGGAAQLAMGYAFRSYLPMLDTVSPGLGAEALKRCDALLPGWTEDSFPGILLNVAAGRVANRFDLGGANYTVDAACGSSLAAASVAVRELESGAADMVLLGGADTVQNPFTYLAFSKTHAFSPRGRCRPFDDRADGIVISEGVAFLVLKRLADAERDGDRIYSVIKGLGSSSDGRAKGLTAPHFQGQVRALRRAYAKAGVSPSSVGYVEAHGTGTAAGDLAEVQALNTVFTEAEADRQACGLGSVKSLIGHTKCAAGLAGLINASLTLYHKTYPPTIGVETPNPRAGLGDGPFHISTESRPWLRSNPEAPRRAGVSAFGFGGTNFHAVLEAYEGVEQEVCSNVENWPAELFLWADEDRAALATTLGRFVRALERGPEVRLCDLAHATSTAVGSSLAGPRLAIVANAIDDLARKCRKALTMLGEAGADGFDPTGVFLVREPSLVGGKTAYLFPGQGSQTPNMLGEIAVHLPGVLAGFERFDEALAGRGCAVVGPRIFPPPTWSAEEKEAQRNLLARTDVAQPAIGAASTSLLGFLDGLGLKADAFAGHSYGELVALHAAGVFPLEALAEISEARGRRMIEAAGAETGAMAALAAGSSDVVGLIDGEPEVVIANLNGPSQCVVSGAADAVGRVLERGRERGVRGKRLAISHAFHSPQIAGAREALTEFVGSRVEAAPEKPVYSNVTARPYGEDVSEIAPRLGEHLVSPVRFEEMIGAMYDDGVRLFVEVGPGSVLTGLAGSILREKPAVAVACEPAGKPGVEGLLHALGRIFVAGRSFDYGALWAGRAVEEVVIRGDAIASGAKPLSASTWLVNGDRARPAHGPAPRRFGPGKALPMVAGRDPIAWVESETRPQGMAEPTISESSMIPSQASNGSTAVFEAFQKTMRNFLELQRSTMAGFLEAPAPSGFVVTTLPAARREEPATTNVPAAIEKPEAPKVEARPMREVEARLLEIVRERTGYPAEILRLDLDLEADLGIDSIKRVEILGSLSEAFHSGSMEAESDLMDQLTRARTLGEIVDRFGQVGKRTTESSGSSNLATLERDEREPGTTQGVRRMRVSSARHPLRPDRRASQLDREGLILITDDGRGIAQGAESRLRDRGYRVLRIVASHDRESGLDLGSEGAVRSFVDQVHQQGRVSAILHASPLRAGGRTGLDARRWDERLRGETRGLFLLARGFAGDLEAAARQGGSSLIAATAMGGAFGSTGAIGEDFFAGDGAVAGLVKTIGREWRHVRTRVVDFDPREAVDSIASALVDELLHDDPRTEVGYVGGERRALDAVGAEFSGREPRSFSIEPGAPIIVTGGARGISAVIAEELAERWRPTLLLLGTSPVPEAREADDVAGVDDPAELKAVLLDRLRRGGESPTPSALERSYRGLRREREIRGNLASLRAHGGRVDYAQVDIRDAEALGGTLEGWRRRFGPPVGFVHGAGMIQDKLLVDKSAESFDRVIGTKLEGALNLVRLIDPRSLQFAAFFSSIAGRFGNRGQSDYAAANEALNKLAIWLDARWECRVVSMMWGPWSGVGMVSDLEPHLGRQGLTMIAPEEGRSRLSDELAWGSKGDVEVIVAGRLGDLLDAQEASLQP